MQRGRMFVVGTVEWRQHRQQDSAYGKEVRQGRHLPSHQHPCFNRPNERDDQERCAVKCKPLVDSLPARTPDGRFEQHRSYEEDGKDRECLGSPAVAPREAPEPDETARHDDPAGADREGKQVDDEPGHERAERIVQTHKASSFDSVNEVGRTGGNDRRSQQEGAP